MSRNSHFLPVDKLIKTFKRKVDPDTISSIQAFADKIVTDIINRSTLLTKHLETDIIDSPEIANVIEKNFDYSFGIRTINRDKKRPSEEHISKMAELSRQK